ncbi:MAG: hypothetical protein ACRD3W_25220, partial [Terriglobales bacterium]
MLLAIMGEELTTAELKTFTAFTGRTKSPDRCVDEAWLAIGRRGGKSAAMSAAGVYIAALCSHSLSRGEKGLVLILAGDRRQAKVILDYCAGILSSTPMLKQMVKEQRRDEIELTNGVSIEVRAATLRGVRGFTCLAVLADEVAFWRS